MKKTIVLGIVIVCIWLMYQFPHVMINPGELSAGHQKLSSKCVACHKPFWGIENDKCIGCHKLSEIGKDTLSGNNLAPSKSKVLFHQQLSNQECTSCHTDHKGLKPEMNEGGFDHQLLSENLKDQCSSCHSKPSDKIHQNISSSCISCHNTDGWKSSVAFNHDMIQGADKNNCIACHNKPIDNLHKQVATSCSSCHNTKGWKLNVVFNHNMIQGADKTNCGGCHQKPNDTYHSNLKDNCDKCHSTTKWLPSTFEHGNYFQLDQNHNSKCVTCHVNNNFKAYTCYGCHEHSESKISSKHIKEGISNFSNCTSCHRSGNEHEIIRNGKSEKGSNQNERKGEKEHDD